MIVIRLDITGMTQASSVAWTPRRPLGRFKPAAAWEATGQAICISVLALLGSVGSTHALISTDSILKTPFFLKKREGLRL